MSKTGRVLILALLVGGAACNKLPTGTVDLNAGTTFVPQVADSIDNVGLGSQVALDSNGIPFVSYVGIPAVYSKSQIPVSRLVTQPFVPGILIASVDKGIWTRGAAAQVEDSAGGQHLPFGPATLKSLDKDLKVDTQNGTSIAIGGSGSVNVAWTDASGVWFDSGSGATGTMGTPVHVYKYSPRITTAGPVGWPSVAVDSNDVPSVAFTTSTGKGEAVEYATGSASGGKWRTQTVATFSPCEGACEAPQRTVLLQTSSGPVILYEDSVARAVVVAKQQGRKWNTSTVESGVNGIGLAGAVASNGTIYASYYTGHGEVHVAWSSGGAWQTSTAGTETEASGDKTALATTGVAVDSKGLIYVTWYDAADDSVKLYSGDGTTFTPMKTTDTQSAGAPSLAVTKDGGVELAWYAETPQDLYLGSIESTSSMVLAQPSPTPAPAQTSSSPSAGCPSSDTEIVAPLGAAGNGYQTKQVTVSSGTFTICFDNEDAAPITHNVDVTTDSAGANTLGRTDIIPPGQTSNVALKNLKPGTYYFHCDVHPTTMTGTLTVK